MSNIPLKTIKFPGLDDTYTVPVVDNSLATAGAAADAKKTGDEITDLKQDLQELDVYTLGLYPQMQIEDTAVASFTDGADDIPVKSLTVDITPVQSGSGDPSPSNVRPISGWTGANVSVFDVNAWDEEWESGIYSPTTGEPLHDSNYIRSKNKIAVISDTEYYVKKPSAAGFRVLYYDNSDAFISSETIADSWTGKAVTIPSNAKYVRIYCGTSTYNHDISINYPSTDHDYHAYKGNVYPISFPSSAGTVYGGTLDVTNGVLTVTNGYVDLGTLTWVQANAANSKKEYYASLTGIKRATSSTSVANLVCSNYQTISSQNAYLNTTGIAVHDSEDRVIIYDESYVSSTAEAFKTAMSGVQCVYELATPVTYQLTPTEVATILGQNNIFADTGNIEELTYRADLKAYIDAHVGS